MRAHGKRPWTEQRLHQNTVQTRSRRKCSLDAHEKVAPPGPRAISSGAVWDSSPPETAIQSPTGKAHADSTPWAALTAALRVALSALCTRLVPSRVPDHSALEHGARTDPLRAAEGAKRYRGALGKPPRERRSTGRREGARDCWLAGGVRAARQHVRLRCQSTGTRQGGPRSQRRHLPTAVCGDRRGPAQPVGACTSWLAHGLHGPCCGRISRCRP